MGVETEVTKANNSFTSELYTHVAKPGANVIFSPLSAHACLSMAYQGAAGSTKEAFAKGLRLPKSELAADGYDVVMSTLNSEPDITLHIANKAYVMNKYKLKQVFEALVTKKFHSEVQSLDFEKNIEAAQEINGWVNEKTREKIPKLFEPDDFCRDTRLVLVNAVYFKGTWHHKFDKEDTRTEPFYVTPDNKIDCQMMHTKRKFNYKLDEELDAQVLEMKYTNSKFSMVVILPQKKDGIDELEKKLANADMSKVLDNMYCPEVIVALPKFKIEQTIDLTKILPKMGLGELFDEKNCNLSEMIDSEEKLVVSKVVQKAFIEVNEEGAEAAAATGMVCMVATCAVATILKKFYANHPFLYVIRTQVNNVPLVLFHGKVTNPKSSDDHRAPRAEPDDAPIPDYSQGLLTFK